jgi:hypothetical protein
MAKHLATSLHVGDRVLVTGRLEQSSWEPKTAAGALSTSSSPPRSERPVATEVGAAPRGSLGSKKLPRRNPSHDLKRTAVLRGGLSYCFLVSQKIRSISAIWRSKSSATATSVVCLASPAALVAFQKSWWSSGYFSR